MQMAFKNIAALILLTVFSLKAGFFSFAPGEPVFPFSGQNAISVPFSPVSDIFINTYNTGGVLIHFFSNNHKPGSNQTENSEWHSVLMPGEAKLVVPGLNNILAAAKYISIGLKTYLIIFPFHAFW
jgi:hypothetical protein